MHLIITSTLFDITLTDTTDPEGFVTKANAEKLFSFFQAHPLFHWQDSHNGCEARADAVCIVLQQWNIPHYKAWVLGGNFLKKHIGGLKQNWNYHVAPLLQVKEADGNLVWYVIDPATAGTLQTMEQWAVAVTAFPHSYHFIKMPQWYIFHEKNIQHANWHSRNRQNRKWMLQGIAGINGLSATGKAKLAFNKGRLKNIARQFEGLKQHSPL